MVLYYLAEISKAYLQKRLVQTVKYASVHLLLLIQFSVVGGLEPIPATVP